MDLITSYFLISFGVGLILFGYLFLAHKEQQAKELEASMLKLTRENKKLSKEIAEPLGQASREAILLLSYCQGDYNDDGILERKELDRDKLEKDLQSLLLSVKKLEFQILKGSGK